MKLNRTGWLSLVLAFMLLFTSVQAGASVARVSVPKGTTHLSAGTVRSVASLEGVKTVTKGKKVTYKIPGPLHFSGKRVVMGKAASKGAPSSISMDSMDSLMGLDDTYNTYSVTQPLLIDVKPSSATINSIEITISDTSVLDVVTDSEDYLYFQAQDTGKATVTVKTSNGKKATKVFTVKDQVLFTSMSVSEQLSPKPNYKQATVKSKTMYAGDATWVMAQPRPFTATYYDYPYYDWYTYCTSAVNFTSSNENVATVDPEGDLYARAPGKATITATARDGSKKKYSFQLTVKAKNPVDFDLSCLGGVNLAPGTTRQINTEFQPADYYDKKVTWTSSDTTVATVDSNGLVTAVSAYSNKYPGGNTATIAGKTNTGRLTSSLTFTVTYNKALTGTPDYRFYGIGNDNYVDNNPTDDYDPALKSCINDMNVMAAAAADAGYVNVSTYTDRTGAGIVSVLQSMAADPAIDENDVTVFFYSGHGAGSDNQLWRGALCGTDGYIVTVDTVQHYLDQVPGTVVVILDSCLSGQYITAKSLSPASRLAATKSFGSAWITKLSGSKATNFTSKALTSSTVKSKYKILVAAESLESSYGDTSPMGFGWFTFWASTGLGRAPDTTNGSSSAGSLLADVNIDKVVSLQELYSFVTTNIMAEWDPIYQQHTQVWPANDNFALVNKTT